MPELSRFLGIVIGMFPREHNPPHFHAVYGEYHVTMEIESGRIKGEFPKRATSLLQEWRTLHQEELLRNWHQIQSGNTAEKIPPLE
jgi:hypothetical protein